MPPKRGHRGGKNTSRGKGHARGGARARVHEDERPASAIDRQDLVQAEDGETLTIAIRNGAAARNSPGSD
ncbi:hypothetical protein FRC08_015087 [Ceratobasidium sp. 394]|nr:hypothetical protein FRC08_015087 [Ceratobasidium sp. 394]